MDLQYVFLEKNDSATTAVEKPKILEVKRKRIKKRKGKKNLLKKCLDSNTPRKFKNKLGKKKLSSSQQGENAGKVDVEPSELRPFENEKKENLGLSSNLLGTNVKKEELESSQELACGKVENPRDSNAKESNFLVQPQPNGDTASERNLFVDCQGGGNFIENEESVEDQSTVKRLNQHDLTNTSANSDMKNADSLPTVSPSSLQDRARFLPTANVGSVDEPSVILAANDLKHAQLDGSFIGKDMDTTVSNYTNDVCMNHISTELESSNVLRGLGLLLETL